MDYLRIFYFATLRYSQVLSVALFVIAYFAIAYTFLADYILTDTLSFLAIIGLPYTCTISQKDIKQKTKKIPLHYFILAIICAILSWIFPLKSVYYFSVIFAFLFAIETYLGEISYLPFCLLVLVSTFFVYLSNTFSIPIRLEISELAANLLASAGFDTQALGNIILLNGREFSVDAACMGLKTLFTAYLIGFFLLAYSEKQRQKLYTLLQLIGFSFIILILTIINNLIRILLLVIFQILPQNPFHDIVGILCLAIYVVLPFGVIIYFMNPKSIFGVVCVDTNKSKIPSQIKKQNIPTTISSLLVFANFLLFFAILGKGIYLSQNPKTHDNHHHYHIDLQGFKKEILSSGMVKFENSEALIYYKPVTGFYGADHSPMICWVGSGYKFKSFAKTTVKNIEIYKGVLQKENNPKENKEKENNQKTYDIIHTAWWFDNGNYQTINQLSWRWQTLRGEPEFSLVNVNANSELDLDKELVKLLGH
jgi:exosortase N